MLTAINKNPLLKEWRRCSKLKSGIINIIFVKLFGRIIRQFF
jgi:hypothetical protein